jgi:hypothetical protein
MAFTKIAAAGIGSTELVTLHSLEVLNNATVGGVLTYEDVTNVDSVGLITARNGIVVGSGITLSKDGDIFATGITTISGNVKVGTGITLSKDGDGFFTGVVTATSFVGDGSGLTNAGPSLTGSTNNTLVTVTGANAITGESDLTFDGSTLGVKRSSSGNVAVNIECSSTTAQSRILFTDSSDTDANVSYDHNDRKLYLGTASNSGLNGDLVIDANGKVCIGANDPVHKLSIIGSGTSLGSDATLLSVGNDSYGSNTYRVIGLGYVSPTEDHPPAVIGYIEKNSSSSTYGDLIFGTRSVNTNTVATERLRITSAGKIGVNNTDPSAAIEVTFDSGGSAPSSGTAPEGIAISYGTSDGKNGGIWFSPGFGDAQGISGICGTRVSGYQTDLRFYTNVTGSARAFTETMRIKENGNVMIGNSSHFTSNVAKLDVVHPGNNTAPTYVSRFFQETNNQGTDHACIQLRHSAATTGSTGVMIDFKNTGGNSHGSIKMAETSVSFNTSSDYRLKENVTEISDGITRLKTLKPYRFNWKADASTTVDGFFAHEVTAVPEAITGTKDEVDSDNNPVYQGIDQSKLVPLLTAALQEAVTKIEVLETRLNNAGIAT